MTKILIVEDDRKILMSLSVRLKAAGYDIVTAQDAMMAMTVAVREVPDLAILDISMPGGNGLTVAQRMQENTKTGGTPFIVLTASNRPELQEKALEIGATAFYTKPYDAEMLLKTVEETVGPAVPAQP